MVLLMGLFVISPASCLPRPASSGPATHGSTTMDNEFRRTAAASQCGRERTTGSARTARSPTILTSATSPVIPRAILCTGNSAGQVLALADPEHLGPHWVLERPKVYANSRTGKFVMYAHLDDAHYKFARVMIAVSNRIAGPYAYVKSFRPLDRGKPRHRAICRRRWVSLLDLRVASDEGFLPRSID